MRQLWMSRMLFYGLIQETHERHTFKRGVQVICQTSEFVQRDGLWRSTDVSESRLSQAMTAFDMILGSERSSAACGVHIEYLEAALRAIFFFQYCVGYQSFRRSSPLLFRPLPVLQSVHQSRVILWCCSVSTNQLFCAIFS